MILQLNSPDAVKTFGLAVMDVYSPRVFSDGYTSAGNASYDLDIVIQDIEPGPQG